MPSESLWRRARFWTRCLRSRPKTGFGEPRLQRVILETVATTNCTARRCLARAELGARNETRSLENATLRQHSAETMSDETFFEISSAASGLKESAGNDRRCSVSTAASVSNFPQPECDRVSHLGCGVRVEGRIFSDQDFQVDGEVDGSLEACGHNLTVGAQAKVKAEIRAQNVSIIGTVEGNIEATDLIELCSQCRVTGQIKTRRIAIKDGAYFKGNIEVVQPSSVVAVRRSGAEVAVIGETEKERAESATNELLATA